MMDPFNLKIGDRFFDSFFLNGFYEYEIIEMPEDSWQSVITQIVKDGVLLEGKQRFSRRYFQQKHQSFALTYEAAAERLNKMIDDQIELEKQKLERKIKKLEKHKIAL